MDQYKYLQFYFISSIITTLPLVAAVCYILQTAVVCDAKSIHIKENSNEKRDSSGICRMQCDLCLR